MVKMVCDCDRPFSLLRDAEEIRRVFESLRKIRKKSTNQQQN